MDQKRKNIVYLIAIGLLILVSFGLSRIGKKDSISYEPTKFTLQENTVITTVVMDQGDEVNRLDYNENQWVVNDTYLLDQGMRDVFFAVISQVEVLRPVSELLNDSISNEILKNGISVKILNNSENVMSYIVLGDPKTQKTYFLDEESMNSFLVHLPGYKSYVAGIYEVKEMDWRDRFVWDVNWTSMKTLKIDYADPGVEDLVFIYDNEFVGIESLNELDTSKMLSYLENIAYLQASEFLTEEDIESYEIKDDLPDIVLSLSEIGDRNVEIRLYRISEKEWVGQISDKEYAKFDQDEIEQLIQSPKDFRPE